MFKDITIGQFFPGESFIHRLDARAKLILTVCYIVMLFVGKNAAAIAVGGVYALGAFALSGIPAFMFYKSIKPVLPVVLFTSLLNLVFIDGEKVLFEFWVIRVTQEGIAVALLLASRIVLLIVGTSLLTYTTSPIALTDAIERLFAPLRKIGAPVHELAMMMTIALRFIPTLIEETDKIMSAQKARGADFESGGIIDRAKAMIPILIPLFVSAFRRAEELATAMECRCYRGGEGRTRLKELKYASRDLVAGAVTLAFFSAVLTMNRMFLPLL